MTNFYVIEIEQKNEILKSMIHPLRSSFKNRESYLIYAAHQEEAVTRFRELFNYSGKIATSRLVELSTLGEHFINRYILSLRKLSLGKRLRSIENYYQLLQSNFLRLLEPKMQVAKEEVNQHS